MGRPGLLLPPAQEEDRSWDAAFTPHGSGALYDLFENTAELDSAMPTAENEIQPADGHGFIGNMDPRPLSVDHRSVRADPGIYN